MKDSTKNFMKKLSKDEMKTVMGGFQKPATVHCCDGTEITSTNNCSNSVGVCNNNGGFDYCMGGY